MLSKNAGLGRHFFSAFSTERFVVIADAGNLSRIFFLLHFFFRVPAFSILVCRILVEYLPNLSTFFFFFRFFWLQNLYRLCWSFAAMAHGP